MKQKIAVEGSISSVRNSERHFKPMRWLCFPTIALAVCIVLLMISVYPQRAERSHTFHRSIPDAQLIPITARTHSDPYGSVPDWTPPRTDSSAHRDPTHSPAYSPAELATLHHCVRSLPW